MDKTRIHSSRMRTARFSGHIYWRDVCLLVQRESLSLGQRGRCLSLGQGVRPSVWGVSASDSGRGCLALGPGQCL